MRVLAAGQQLLFGGRKFSVVQDAGGVQLGQLVQLFHHWRTGGGRSRRLRGLLLGHLGLHLLHLHLLLGHLLLHGRLLLALVGGLLLARVSLLLAMVDGSGCPGHHGSRRRGS
jgi:hypothetical protein